MTKPTGGPMFPGWAAQTFLGPNGEEIKTGALIPYAASSYRQWLIGCALASGQFPGGRKNPDECAKWAISIADAVMARFLAEDKEENANG